MGIWTGYADGYPFGFIWLLNPKTKRDYLTHNVTFLGKSNNEWDKVEVLAFFQVSYKESDDEEVFDHEMVPKNNKSDNYNVANNNLDCKGQKHFDQKIGEKVKVSHDTTSNPKVL